MKREALHRGLDFLSSRDERFALAISEVGMPVARHSAANFASLLRIIVGQQVSVAAANSIMLRLEAKFPLLLPEDFVLVSSDDLRSLGLSYQKVSYVQGLSSVIISGDFSIEGLFGLSDAAVIGELMLLRGFGRWSAENFCLFSLGREDLFPVDDLALRAGLGLYLGLVERPSAGDCGDYVECWRPYRSAAAIFIWHYYGVKKKRVI